MSTVILFELWSWLYDTRTIQVTPDIKKKVIKTKQKKEGKMQSQKNLASLSPGG